MSTDGDWERWGSDNPYFGVLSDPKFLGSKLKTTNEEDFYNSGKEHVEWVMGYVRLLGKSKFKRAVDFGCGAGRLTIPLASYASKVVGLDVSPSILNEAKHKTPKKLHSKISYDLSDKQFESLPSRYDFVHSFIVLQHIPPRRGEAMIKKLLENLEPSGIAALHITYAYEAPLLKKTIVWTRNHVVPIHYVLNILRGRPWDTPRMRMHLYNLEQVSRIFTAAGIKETVQIATDHGGYIGTMIIGKKL